MNRTPVVGATSPAGARAGPGLRPLLGALHRWAGLAIAAFLFVSGLTGAVISWDHELDDLLNPGLVYARSTGPAVSPLELARRIEARDPQVMTTYVPLAAEPGRTLAFGVAPKRDPSTGWLFRPGYNQVFIDPATGQEQGRRAWGAAWPITKETFVSFLYVLHYSLHVPAFWGWTAGGCGCWAGWPQSGPWIASWGFASPCRQAGRAHAQEDRNSGGAGRPPGGSS